MEFQAAIHGAEMKKENTSLRDVVVPAKKQVDYMKFGDPEDYKDMPAEDREALTQKMMGAHKAWARKAPLST